MLVHGLRFKLEYIVKMDAVGLQKEFYLRHFRSLIEDEDEEEEGDEGSGSMRK